MEKVTVIPMIARTLKADVNPIGEKNSTTPSSWYPKQLIWLFINLLSPSIKILLSCHHFFFTEVVKISIEFNLCYHVLNSHDLPN